jgi:hypothetical protein
MDSVLRPRDIQARIRSGESPEAVAAAAQTTVDKIMGFATPVLAERAYVAEQAQKASVRRRAGDGPIGLLGQAVAERLATRDIDPESVEWDAWRREDGRWTLVADFGVGQSGSRASFVYDTAGRYVVADDDESRWLVGERRGTEATPSLSSVDASPQTSSPASSEGPSGVPPEPARRLSSVGSEQVPLGDDAIEVVTGRRPVASPEEPTVDLTEATSAAASGAGSAARPRISAEPEALFDAPAAPVVPPRQGEPADGRAADNEPAHSERDLTEQDPAGQEPAGQEPAGEPKQRKPAKGRGRASVPSWDEIMFGSSRGE